ncbi:MAG: DNA repair protein RadA, partial [Microbacterium sp.]
MATKRSAPPAFACTECGWTTAKWVGRCGECQQWGTVVEQTVRTGILNRVDAASPSRSARPITQITTADAPRRSS